MNSTAAPSSVPPKSSSPWWPVLAVAALTVLTAWPLIFTQYDRDRGRADQINYHLPTVLRMGEQMPTPDISDYLSSTTPGFHLVLAAVAHYVSDSFVVLQLAGSIFSLVFLCLVTRWLTMRVGPIPAFLMAAGLSLSLYVYSSTVFMLPDNAAWLFVAAILFLGLRRRIDAWFYVVGGACLVLLVLTRQSHIWAATVMWAAAWLGGEETSSKLFESIPKRAARAVVAFLATLPAFGVLAWFHRLWGGLTPPFFQGYVEDANLATPAIVLAQLGVLGALHVGYWWRGLARACSSAKLGVLLTLIVAFALLVIPETSFDPLEGRSSGIWGFVRPLPLIAARTSVVVLGMGAAGAIVLVGYWWSLAWRERWVMAAALAGFVAAMTMNENAWPRYHEPFLLLILATSSALAITGTRPGAAETPLGPTLSRLLDRLRVPGLVALCGLLTLITASKLLTGDPANLRRRHPRMDRSLPELWPESWRTEGPPPVFSVDDGLDDAAPEQ